MEALASGCRVVTTALPGTLEVLGRADENLVTLLELPPLETVDRPFARDETILETRLAHALEAVVEKVVKEPSVDPEPVERLTRPFTWESVFARVEGSYTKALEARSQHGIPHRAGDPGKT
jgi:hypothetical protein